MRENIIQLTALILASLFTTISQAQDTGVRVTVYNSNLALVVDRRAVDLPSGVGEYSFRDVAAQIDPTSVRFTSVTNANNLDVLEQNFEYDLVSADKLLRKYVDEQVKLVTKNAGTVQGKLLSALGQLVIQGDDGSLKIINNAEILSTELPKLPAGLITQPTLVWQLNNRGPARQTVEVAYLTSGMSWHVEYVGKIDANDANLDLSAWVTIENNSGATYPNASLQLVAGDVHRAQEPPQPLYRKSAMQGMVEDVRQFEEQPFFEYHLYSLSRPATLKEAQQKQISLFPSTRTGIEKKYVFDGMRGKNVDVKLSFKNRAEAGLGMALPAGTVRIYKPEGKGNLVMVGEDRIKHTPKNENVELKLGSAFDIVGERKQMSYQQLGDRAREEKYRIVLRNHKDTNITVEVVEHYSGDWTIRESTLPFTKKDANTALCNVPVAKDGEATVEYTVMYKW
jgi:hypothetical protein